MLLLWWVAVFSAMLTLVFAENAPSKRTEKRSYVCPPDFVRLSNKCYYFSTSPVTWQDAFWKCSDLHSNLATIRSPYQDKILRRLLEKNTAVSSERWIGGRYNWEQMIWQWAASGKHIDYQGFLGPQPSDNKESMRWHCIILNPRLHYRWDHRSCLEKKHFICQTKIKNVSKKGKKKLEKQYNATKYKKLNEVPVPNLPEIASTNTENNEISNANFAHAPKALRKRRGRKGRGKGKKKKNNKRLKGDGNAILQDAPHKESGPQSSSSARALTKKEGDGPVGRLSWKTYYKATISPLHPRGIVEEFSYT